MKTILVTGSAGFIGFHLARFLLERGDTVVGIDNFNDYYDPEIKEARNAILERYGRFSLLRGDISDLAFVQEVFGRQKIDVVCNLAAQAGVRYSLTNPHAYVQANIVGFVNVMETARQAGIGKVVYASSSSVYGSNQKVPFSVEDRTDSPISLYAASKKSNELIAHVYHHLYGLDCIGLRFFTVYGPWGRPDMALFTFAERILSGQPIDVYNQGEMRRDFTYIDDIVSGVVAAIDSGRGCRVYNLGGDKTEGLLDFIAAIEKALGRQAEKRLLPLQPGDVPATMADITSAREELGFDPKTRISEGIPKAIEWFLEWRGVGILH